MVIQKHMESALDALFGYVSYTNEFVNTSMSRLRLK